MNVYIFDKKCPHCEEQLPRHELAENTHDLTVLCLACKQASLVDVFIDGMIEVRKSDALKAVFNQCHCPYCGGVHALKGYDVDPDAVYGVDRCAHCRRLFEIRKGVYGALGLALVQDYASVYDELGQANDSVQKITWLLDFEKSCCDTHSQRNAARNLMFVAIHYLDNELMRLKHRIEDLQSGRSDYADEIPF